MTYHLRSLKAGEMLHILDFAPERVKGIAEVADDGKSGLILILGFRPYRSTTPQGERETP
jgi:hypothetical protein